MQQLQRKRLLPGQTSYNLGIKLLLKLIQVEPWFPIFVSIIHNQSMKRCYQRWNIYLTVSQAYNSILNITYLEEIARVRAIGRIGVILSKLIPRQKIRIDLLLSFDELPKDKKIKNSPQKHLILQTCRLYPLDVYQPERGIDNLLNKDSSLFLKSSGSPH